MTKVTTTPVCVLFLLMSRLSLYGAAADPYERINTSWDQFGAVYNRVVEHYYSNLDHDEIMRSAIDGLLRGLDPYSQFFDEEGLRQLRQDTTGRFAGLGITVGIKDNYPVVIAPIAGTPAARAGLLPGDLIVAVESADTFGMSLEQVVTTLRGEPGSAVRITVARLGTLSNWDVELVREIITIRSVAVANMVTPGVGYIGMRQTRFSENTADEVEQALRHLVDKGAEKFILDLRGNPGGLLTQATQVADLFLPNGAPIVSIRERDGRREQTRYSQRRPLAGSAPVVVLIDGGSASAAEIVAGAIQDNDRGLVVGTDSFGKGSVQTIFDLGDRERGALKLTTALYYTPSGRSIHRESLASRGGLLMGVDLGGVELPASVLLGIILRSPDAERAASELRARFDLDEDAVTAILEAPLAELVGHGPVEDAVQAIPDEVYFTANGREVRGGGGISPDIEVEAETQPEYVRHLLRGRTFFDFIVDYVGAEMIEPPDSLTAVDVDERMMDAFKAFVPRILDDEENATGRDQVDTLRQLAAEGGWDEHISTLIDSVEGALDRNAGAAFPSYTEQFVRSGLKRELALRLRGREASLLASLEDDVLMRRVIELLGDEDRYLTLLGSK